MCLEVHGLAWVMYTHVVAVASATLSLFSACGGGYVRGCTLVACTSLHRLLCSLRRGILNNPRVLGIDTFVTTCVKALVSASVYVYGAELLRVGFVVLIASHFMLVQV